MIQQSTRKKERKTIAEKTYDNTIELRKRAPTFYCKRFQVTTVIADKVHSRAKKNYLQIKEKKRITTKH